MARGRALRMRPRPVAGGAMGDRKSGAQSVVANSDSLTSWRGTCSSREPSLATGRPLDEVHRFQLSTPARFFSVVLAALFFLVRHRLLLVANLKPADIQTALQAWRSINHPLRLINFAAFAYILWSLPRSIDKSLMGLSAFRLRHPRPTFSPGVCLVDSRVLHCLQLQALPPAWRTLLVCGRTLAIPAWLHQRWTLRRANIFSLTTANTNALVETPFAAAGPNHISLPADGEA